MAGPCRERPRSRQRRLHLGLPAANGSLNPPQRRHRCVRAARVLLARLHVGQSHTGQPRDGRRRRDEDVVATDVGKVAPPDGEEVDRTFALLALNDGTGALTAMVLAASLTSTRWRPAPAWGRTARPPGRSMSPISKATAIPTSCSSGAASASSRTRPMAAAPATECRYSDAAARARRRSVRSPSEVRPKLARSLRRTIGQR